MPTYRGSCHCGRIRFEADGPIESVLLCNCSICHRTGYLHWPVAPERFRLLAEDAEYATYEFGTRVAKHHPVEHFDGQNWDSEMKSRSSS